MATPAEPKQIETSQLRLPRAVLDSPASHGAHADTGALLVLAFWPILVGIYGSWFDEHAYMEHGLLVIPAAAYMVWTQRERARNAFPPAVRLGSGSLDWGSSASRAGT